ncbi:DUF2840 domain-containing protein [Sphingobium sp. TKS]|uniref:DUF2840 domain-containing protein n=1 Tax=Sphingobium sp. TKS TaxID=1315974 RepID=UPI00076FF738|nr:DUF2840 domain-containing protein [Sphingobium sp. TKS]AMK21688.1 hypothetical protein K426_03660 [Sphingobium sp. TKS]
MTSATASGAPRGLAPLTRSADTLTHVELTHIEQRIENWIRFGRHVREQILDRRRRVLSYRPYSVFGFVRWAANDFGTVASRIDILRAVGPTEAYQTLPFIRPGGEILLSVDGWPKVSQVLRLIDAVEAAGLDACDVAPDHWRHVANRMSVGQAPRAYTPERHHAWLKRREIEG